MYFKICRIINEDVSFNVLHFLSSIFRLLTTFPVLEKNQGTQRVVGGADQLPPKEKKKKLTFLSILSSNWKQNGQIQLQLSIL